MQSENFDKKIKEAAEHYSPSRPEEAWEKMESLLDKHLPQKRKNNKLVFLLLLGFLLIGGGTVMLVKKPFGNNSSITGSKADQPNNTDQETNNNSINNETLNPNSKKHNDIKDSKIEKKEQNINPSITPQLAENNLNGINNNVVKNIKDKREIDIASGAGGGVEGEEPGSSGSKLPPGNQNNFVQDDKKAEPEI